MARRRVLGFTLIELLVAMTVIAILAAVAIPQYSQYVTRSKRASATTVLLQAAGTLERNYTTNGCYNRTSVPGCRDQSGPVFDLGALFAPSEGRASYSIGVDGFGGAGQAFTLTATPCFTAGNCPAGSDNFDDAECGSLTLTNAGARGITGAGTVAGCWQR